MAKAYTKEEFQQKMTQRGISSKVQERVLRLNSFPHPRGCRIRGIHRKETTFSLSMLRGGVQVKEFIQKYGKAIYRGLPRNAFIRRRNRKLIRYEWIEDNIPTN